MELVPLIAHPVRGVTEGFYRLGRWLQLARDSLEDLGADRANDDSTRGDRTAFLVVTRRIDNDLMQLDEDERSDEDALKRFAARFVETLLNEDPTMLARGEIQVASIAHASVAEAVAKGATLLESGACERALVLAVDSWFDPGLLGNAAAEHRVKIGGSPVGFMPGEAAVALMLEDGAKA